VIDIELPAGGEEAVAKAAELLSNAKFPVILNGGGVVIGGAIKDSMALAEKLLAPVCCGRGDWPAITMIIFRNYHWGAEKRNTTLWYSDNFVGTELNRDVSYTQIAKAFGIEGVQTTSMDDLTAKLSAAVKAQMEEGKTTFIEVLTNMELGEPFRRDAMTAPVAVAEIDKADMRSQKMPYFAGVFGNIPSIKFAKKLLEKLSNHDKVYFSNSGSEANEKAFKLIRQASHIDPARKGKYKIMYRDRDYQGTTIGTMSASGQAQRKEGYGPFAEGFVEFPHCTCYRCPYDKTYGNCDIECARLVEDIILKEGADTIGGMIVEPITAGGGVLIPVKEYYPLLQEICKKYDIWMIMDEVVCGFGRTGTFWGHEHYDVDPEIITMAKGLANSYGAFSATVVKQKVYDAFLNDPNDPETRRNYFRDISTYGGCTAALTAALESTRIIEDENLLDNSVKVGAYLNEQLEKLRKYDIVGDVRERDFSPVLNL
jgi:adenosylmethionine-8-amino-7-oxononanoate aminotransferase